MLQLQLFGISITVVVSVLSLPYPIADITHGQLKNSSPEARSRFTFPNNIKFQSGHIVRTPQGTWSRIGENDKSKVVNSEGIVFPDKHGDKNDVGVLLPVIPPKTTPECAAGGSTFCEKVDNYPGKYLENILPKIGQDFIVMFGNDTPPEIQQRIDSSDENPLCPSVEQIVYPKMAKNKENIWLFVVNQGPYTQGVRIEKCLDSAASKSCAFTEGFPLGYKTVCRQKHIYRKLVALRDGKTVTDTFQLPSCCSCSIKNEGVHSRAGYPAHGAVVRGRNVTIPKSNR